MTKLSLSFKFCRPLRAHRSYVTPSKDSAGLCYMSGGARIGARYPYRTALSMVEVPGTAPGSTRKTLTLVNHALPIHHRWRPKPCPLRASMRRIAHLIAACQEGTAKRPGAVNSRAFRYAGSLLVGCNVGSSPDECCHARLTSTS